MEVISYTPGLQCCPDAVSKANGTFIFTAKDWFWALATVATEAMARTAAKRRTETVVKVRIVFLLFGRRFHNRLHLLRRTGFGKSEIDGKIFFEWEGQAAPLRPGGQFCPEAGEWGPTGLFREDALEQFLADCE